MQSWDATEAAATNRLRVIGTTGCPASGTRVCYDAAGNLIFDNTLGSAGTRTYDAENRMITAAGGGANSYGYNADGKRVRRVVAAQTFHQVYGLGGELAGEYLWNGSTATLQKEYGYRDGDQLIVAEGSTVRWLVKDHLGTPRILADQTGSLAGVTRHDYFPFGEENLQGAQRTGNGYQADNVRQKFGSKERDTETGMDFFEARYLSSVQSRFTSVDPIFFQAEMQTDPQRFNLYSYVRNNPLRFIDPKGEAIELLGTDEEKRKRALAAIQSAVGEAGKYLYIDKKVIDGKDRYFIGIYTNGPDGKGKGFKDINSVAGEIAPIIGDSKVVGIEVVEQGRQVGKSIFSTNESLCKCNSTAIAGTADVDGNNFKIYITIPKPGDAYDRAKIDSVHPVEMEDARPGIRDIGIVIGHELGHARALMTGAALGSERSNNASLRLENKVRTLRGSTYSQRDSHGVADAIGKQ